MTPDQRVQSAAQALARNQRDEALQHLRAALASDPNHPGANHYLGMLLAQSGDLKGAIPHLETALRASPDNPALLCNLAMLKSGAGLQDEAVALFQRALALNPNLPDAHACLGVMRANQQRAAEAEEHFLAALRLAPNRPDCVYAYTRMLTETGRADEAVAVIRRAQQAAPNDLLLQSKLCMMLNYLAGPSPEDLFREHQRFGQLAPRSAAPPAPADSDPDRPLRIGFVSADLREHSVAYFLEPILEHRDRTRFLAFAYQIGPGDDTVTPRLRSYCDGWRTLFPSTDDQLLAAIAADRLDVLIDLAGHTSGNRLTVFARRAAPVQITCIGYPNTTGLPTIDGRIVDAVTDPPGAESLATERLIRIDPCFLCYRPPVAAPAPTPNTGPLTFCSFNSLAKPSPPTIALWSRLLAAHPGSRLLLKGKALSDPSVADRFRARFAAHGVAADRLELLGHTPTTADHLAHYHRADIALDPFPYNGTTTTCEALLMGRPVVTLRGDRHAARVGASLLTTVGFPDWIAASEDDYLRIASSLAAARPDPSQIRDRFLNSTLCDARAYAPRFEAAIRALWRDRRGA